MCSSASYSLRHCACTHGYRYILRPGFTPGQPSTACPSAECSRYPLPSFPSSFLTCQKWVRHLVSCSPPSASARCWDLRYVVFSSVRTGAHMPVHRHSQAVCWSPEDLSFSLLERRKGGREESLCGSRCNGSKQSTFSINGFRRPKKKFGVLKQAIHYNGSFLSMSTSSDVARGMFSSLVVEMDQVSNQSARDLGT